jgi:hypothetical protein
LEYVAEDLGFSLAPYYDDQVGNNFAVGAAGTGENNSNNDDIEPFFPGVKLPGLATEITDFENSLGSANADPNGLYFVWAGPNDFLDYLGGSNPSDPAILIEQAVTNMVDNITRLMDLGAEKLVVPNMPPLGRLPFSKEFQEEATAVSIAFDGGLALALDNLGLGSDSSDTEIIPIDIFTITEGVIAEPAQFDLTNVTDAFLLSGLPLPTEPTAKTGFLFWDIFHPTTEGHEIFGDAILQTLNGEIPFPSFNQIAGTPKNESLVGTKINDNMDGFAGRDTIVGFAGDDRLEGWEGNDWLFGNQGNDILSGGEGRDELSGGLEDDLLLGGDGNDTFSGGGGSDILIGNAGNDSLWGGRDADYILGGDGKDTLSGEQGDDLLHGGAGNDFLSGGIGNDLLRGGEGKDNLTGNGGADLFELAENQGTDMIADFKSGTDLLILSGSLTFGSLSFSDNQLSVTATGKTLAILNGIDTTTLTEADFVQ